MRDEAIGCGALIVDAVINLILVGITIAVIVWTLRYMGVGI